MNAAAASVLVLLILAMGAGLIVAFFVMPFFAFDVDGEIKARRPQSRIRSGRTAKGMREKMSKFLKRRSPNA
jgi:hypothetical protein